MGHVSLFISLPFHLTLFLQSTEPARLQILYANNLLQMPVSIALDYFYMLHFKSIDIFLLRKGQRKGLVSMGEEKAKVL